MSESHATLIADEIARLRAERSAPTRREADLEQALRCAVREMREIYEENSWALRDLDGYRDWCALVGIDPATGKPVKGGA